MDDGLAELHARHPHELRNAGKAAAGLWAIVDADHVVVTAIPPDGGPTTTQTFSRCECERAAQFIASKNGNQNIYFTVNETRSPVSSKTRKGDIARARFLHVDIDPGEGENPEQAKARGLAALRALPPPTVIVDS